MFLCRQFLALTRLTIVESLRQPLSFLLSATATAAIGLAPLLLMHSFGEDGKLVRDTALAIHFMGGLFLSTHLAATCLAEERRRGTLCSVLSKPVWPSVFFLSKFAGIAAVLACFSFCATLAGIMAERVSEHFSTEQGFVTDWRAGLMLVSTPAAAALLAGIVNYRLKRPFPSSAFVLLIAFTSLAALSCGFFDRLGRWHPFHFHFHWAMLPAEILVGTAIATLAAVALALSVRFEGPATLSFCFALLVAGLAADHIAGAAHSRPLSFAIQCVLPDWQQFWQADRLNGGGRIPPGHIAGAVLYAFCYTSAALTAGSLIFRNTEAS